MNFDVLFQRGEVYDGTGAAPRCADIGVRDGRVVAISEAPLPSEGAREVVDARGCWVTPGFIDLHTHYDAEVEAAPGLSESVRHGVTTVLLGSCSLSFAVGTPEDLADMYSRVEAVPYNIVRPLLERVKTWTNPRDYLEHLDALPLGPNVASFLGHSAMRAHIMGMERSLSHVAPSDDELRAQERMLEEALDDGYLGASIQTLPWDKVGGDRFRSRPLPSTFARWSEYRRLTRILRRRQRVFQGVPNVSTKVNALLFLWESMGWFRKRLKTTVISLMDVRYNRQLWWQVGGIAQIANDWLGADFRLQALPEVFDLWADGIDLVVFEEFGAGAAALHLQSTVERRQLFADPAYRSWFKRQWQNRLLPRVFHRDFNQSEILACPDGALVGKSFAQVAQELGRDVVDVFLDLVSQFGEALRWYTVMGNDRPEALQRIVDHPAVLIGFSDAGAHLRQMAHYNFPLRLLHKVWRAEVAGKPFMSRQRAVYRLTGELGEWLGLDAGILAEGKRADLVVIDPEGLDDSVEQVHEEAMPAFSGHVRLVRRNDRAVRGVWIRGQRAVDAGKPVAALGSARGMGQVLRAVQSPRGEP